MNISKISIILISLTISLNSCVVKNKNSDNIEITGILLKQGITFYQYGTHTISGYAVRSKSVNLDEYVNKNITVIGIKIEGYPIEGGPDFIEVFEVKNELKQSH